MEMKSRKALIDFKGENFDAVFLAKAIDLMKYHENAIYHDTGLPLIESDQLFCKAVLVEFRDLISYYIDLLDC